MEMNKKVYAVMMMVVATLWVFAMAEPVMADHYGTFEGTVTSQGQLMTHNGSEYTLVGQQADQIKNNVDQKVKIKGLLRENGGPSDLYSGSTIEVYSYKWMSGMNSDKNMWYPY